MDQIVDQNSRNIFGMVVRKNTHKDIRRLKKQLGVATIHGNKFWMSTSLLIDYLQVNPPKPQMKILEIGCGWGIGGIYCAKNYQCEVTLLDADATVLPYAQYHADINEVSINTLQLRYEKITKAMLGEYDMVIASDICFWDEMVKPLKLLVDRCYNSGVQRVVMTDPGRQPFRDMAIQCMEKYAAFYENWSAPHPYNTSGLVLDIG